MKIKRSLTALILGAIIATGGFATNTTISALSGIQTVEAAVAAPSSGAGSTLKSAKVLASCDLTYSANPYLTKSVLVSQTKEVYKTIYYNKSYTVTYTDNWIYGKPGTKCQRVYTYKCN